MCDRSLPCFINSLLIADKLPKPSAIPFFKIPLNHIPILKPDPAQPLQQAIPKLATEHLGERQYGPIPIGLIIVGLSKIPQARNFNTIDILNSKVEVNDPIDERIHLSIIKHGDGILVLRTEPRLHNLHEIIVFVQTFCELSD